LAEDPRRREEKNSAVERGAAERDDDGIGWSRTFFLVHEI
jgi:hypothetical protein